MRQSSVFDKNVKKYEDWYENNPHAFQSELEAIRQQIQTLPENISGIEVGLGTGRFASHLGIKEGVEPSLEMAKLAAKRGIEVVEGVAERLPYSDMKFDFVLFVTVCFFQNLKEAIKEAKRVLKPRGSLIIGFLDADKTIARSYTERKKESVFYKKARFLTVKQISSLVLDSGFKDLSFNQTLFTDPDQMTAPDIPRAGFDKGSFIVVKASKK